ncbi:hypothetical protein VMUT_0614 [Vulcanisaeta moutnovskia 768-28]|uniref:EamA domain-containing protein n=1 Tax=Vulcanisaeta moutnovskia (strain 768-28) TaxID=985053 RepID=F0QVH2_VULM7|nr:hypothetical protein [Vulcanisaeta moutnovskia]ADY00825.1 hypothetical protein VMUT_0614 [Vulcanisaeta moutnovskia 768-28]
MTKRYLVLAILASALWGISYPITYVALRFFGADELIATSYLFSILLLTALLYYNYDTESIIKGLLLSPINYIITYLYVELSNNVGGLTALVSSSYIIPLIIINYINNEGINIRHIISAITLLSALYLLFQGYGDPIYIALLLMVMNLIYTIVLAKINNIDIINFVFGQSLGTLVIAYLTMRKFIMLSLIFELNYFYYPLLLALIGNVIPYTLYAVAIRHVGPVEVSLTSSVETISSLITSIPMQQLPANPVAWTLLIISILSLNIELREFEMKGRSILISDYTPSHQPIKEVSLWSGRFKDSLGFVGSCIITKIPRKKKVI